MKRPIIWANIFLAFGILLGRFADGRTVLFFMFLTFAFCLCLYLKYKYLPVFVILLFAAAGAVRVGESETDPTYGESIMAQNIEGVVIEKGLTGSGNQKLTVRLESPVKTTVRDVLEKNETVYIVKRLMVYTAGDAPSGAVPSDTVPLGAAVKISGEIEPLEKPVYPWSYDEFTYLRSRKIDAKMFTYDVEVLPNSGRGIYWRLPVWLRQARDRLAGVYDAALPPREAGIMKSIILGDKADLEDSAIELYRTTGIYHILCISGLHVGIFMLIVGWIFKLFLPERYAWLVGFCVLLLYALLTGASVSTVRAAAMGGVFAFSKMLFREYDLRASTSFACIALLLYEPLYLYDAGFQLSFAAVFGISYLTAPVERLLSIPLRNFPLKNTLASGMGATLATCPFLMFHFYEVSVYGIIVNLVVIPTASILVGAGLAVGLAGLVFLPAAVFLAGISYYLLKIYDIVCGFFAGLPLAVIHTGHVGIFACAAFFAALAGFVYAFSDFTHKWKRKMLTVWGGLLVFAVCFFVQTYPFAADAVKLDSGTVIRYRNRVYVAEDGGAGREMEDCLRYYNAEDAVKIPKGKGITDGVLRIFNGDAVYVAQE